MPSDTSAYIQGHSDAAVATHLLRTAESDASFLIPHLKATDRILDVGCGPGTITVSLAKYVPLGSVTGVDFSETVLDRARSVAAIQEGSSEHEKRGTVLFQYGDVLKRLPFDDDTFDVAFASQVFCHIAPMEHPLHALQEMRRIVKPGGIIATRDGIAQHFYPPNFELDRLWSKNFAYVMRKRAPEVDATNLRMPALFRQAGFNAEAGRVLVSVDAKTFATTELRSFLGQRCASQLSSGDPLHKSWIGAGIPQSEIDETIAAAKAWSQTPDAYFVAVQCQVMGHK